MSARSRAASASLSFGSLVPQGRLVRTLLLTGLWSAVGLLWALQGIAAAAVDGGAVTPWTRLAYGWMSGLLWVPITLFVLALRRRFPLKGDGWRDALLVHLTASLTVPFLYNLVVVLFGPSPAAEGLLASATSGTLQWLHITVAVYWCILALDRWVERAKTVAPAPRSGSSGPRRGGARESVSPATRIRIRRNGRTRLVEPEEIAWIEGAGDYVRIHTDEDSFLASARLADLADRLDPATFLRIHRSTIVSLDRIRSYRPLGHGDYLVVLRDGSELRVSRSRGKEFRRRLEARDAST